MSDSLRPHGLQHTGLPSPSPTPGVYSNSCPLSRWCHPTISSSVVPFFSRLQSSPASGSFPTSQLFASDGQSTNYLCCFPKGVLRMKTTELVVGGWPGGWFCPRCGWSSLTIVCDSNEELGPCWAFLIWYESHLPFHNDSVHQNLSLKQLKPIIQSEVSQKEKDKYHIVMHIYGI